MVGLYLPPFDLVKLGSDILDSTEITRIWKEYRLESRTRFNVRPSSSYPSFLSSNERPVFIDVHILFVQTPVTSAKRAPGSSSPGAKWIINDNEDEIFDAIIVTIGTCGKPQMVGFPGMPKDKAPPKKEKNGEPFIRSL